MNLNDEKKGYVENDDFEEAVIVGNKTLLNSDKKYSQKANISINIITRSRLL